MNDKPNWALRIAVALPIAMIGLIALSIYVPTVSQRFYGRFVYAVPLSAVAGPAGSYMVSQGKVVTTSSYLLAASSATVRPQIAYPALYVHDLATNTSREVTFAEAQALTLDPSMRSAEGVEIVNGNRTEGIFPLFLFSSTDYSTMYAQKGRGSLKLNLATRSTTYYVMPIQFLGWVKS